MGDKITTGLTTPAFYLPESGASIGFVYPARALGIFLVAACGTPQPMKQNLNLTSRLSCITQFVMVRHCHQLTRRLTQRCRQP